MIGILLLTHGPLGKALLETLESIVGPQQQIECFSIYQSDNAEVIRDELNKSIDKLNSGNGVVILTDMFGGTPSIEVIAGVNLPMLIKLTEDRKVYGLQEAAQRAFEAGRKYIQIASTLLAPI